MSSEEHKDQEFEDEPFQESRQTDTWNKDVSQTGRWGILNKKELWLVASIILVVIGVAAAGVIIATSFSETVDQPGTKIDPATGIRVSAYQFPVPPAPVIITDQEELDFVRGQLANDSNTAQYLKVIPKSVAELQSVDVTADPYVRAASWLVTVDTVNAQDQAVNRFALASIFYATHGEAWTNRTNWLTSENHCDWYGITCCAKLQGAINCSSVTSFSDIAQIDLYNNKLVGPIPTALSLLKQLQSLFMNENALTGKVPGPVLAALPRFTKLYLQHNQLTGTVPAELNTNGIFGMCHHVSFLPICVRFRGTGFLK